MRSVGRPGNSRLETEWFTEELRLKRRRGGQTERVGGSAPDKVNIFPQRYCELGIRNLIDNEHFY